VSPFPVEEGAEFSTSNLPYGIFSPQPGEEPRVGVALGEAILDLASLLGEESFRDESLNVFMSQGPAVWSQVRGELTRLLEEASPEQLERHSSPRSSAEMHLPIEVADYVDFYASEHHATNMGHLFRPGSEPLTPNWKHLPIGYHGRAGTVVVSGTPVRRPCGQKKPPTASTPSFGPSARLDIEAEVGFVVGVPSNQGEAVSIDSFSEHVFGVVLLNDWSARDIHAWEYVPLGPFLGKSFATSISPWVVPLAALEAARTRPLSQEPEPLEYLRGSEPWALDLSLEVELNGTVVARPPFAEMYWTPAQQLAHMTVNGASLRTGDLFASGTVSGSARETWGSFLELSWNGERPLQLQDGTERTFLEDGDTVVLRASAPAIGGGRLGFGEVRGTILPANC
jgi:fumarylacetoacetase